MLFAGASAVVLIVVLILRPTNVDAPRAPSTQVTSWASASASAATPPPIVVAFASSTVKLAVTSAAPSPSWTEPMEFPPLLVDGSTPLGVAEAKLARLEKQAREMEDLAKQYEDHQQHDEARRLRASIADLVPRIDAARRHVTALGGDGGR